MKNFIVTIFMLSTLMISAQAMARCESTAGEDTLNDLSEKIGSIKGFEAADVSFEAKDSSKYKNGNTVQSISTEEIIIESVIAGMITNETVQKTIFVAHKCTVTLNKEYCVTKSLDCKTTY
ncbi:MAG: hypothetical protein K2Q18_11480 [Bdellovibrionales bacterium]|nr:hypothetical protein [Bdellovibrionales bacterium]